MQALDDTCYASCVINELRTAHFNNGMIVRRCSL